MLAAVQNKALWNDSPPEGSKLPPPGDVRPADRVFTFSEAAKRLGIHLSTLHRLVRDGALWGAQMKNGQMGLRESELQRFICRSKPVQKGK